MRISSRRAASSSLKSPIPGMTDSPPPVSIAILVSMIREFIATSFSAFQIALLDHVVDNFVGPAKAISDV